ncbi:hypothetical protein [Mangrovibacillus sp. Mu-81]
MLIKERQQARLLVRRFNYTTEMEDFPQ